jgi:hypothetical protein
VLALALLIFLLGLWPVAWSAEGGALPANGAPRPALHAPRPALPLAAGWISKLFIPLRSALGNQVRMIQVATIGMCIGLFILMRK